MQFRLMHDEDQPQVICCLMEQIQQKTWKKPGRCKFIQDSSRRLHNVSLHSNQELKVIVRQQEKGDTFSTCLWTHWERV